MRSTFWRGLTAAVLLACAGPALAEALCGAGAAPIDLARMLQGKAGSVAHLWGRDNIAVLPKEAGTEGGVLRVSYPAGSFSPGRSEVRGGAGFELRHGSARAACLAYKVRFPPGFDFVKGGKLPGLFSGDAPRGCIADDTVSGFSSRLMWRAGGAGELYLYAPGRETACGQSLGRGTWTFTPGAWTAIVERVAVNTPGAADGSIQVWVDGHLAVDASGLRLATVPAPTVDGLLFATFFGGSDASWATPRDQTVDFADVTLTGMGPDGF